MKPSLRVGGWCLAAVLAVSFLSPLARPVQAAQEPGGLPNLRSTLEKELRARRPAEFAFIAQVVARVDTGVLPRAMVESTFQWARKKPRYPFQYFERALKVRAKQIGVSL